MKASIFISYRRGQNGVTPTLVNSIADALKKQYGEDNVFLDKKSLHAGKIFAKEIENRISSSSLVIVMIAENWLRILKEREKIGELDWHRQEVEIALNTCVKLDRNDKNAGDDLIPVIPVAIDGGVFPCEEDLPESLKPLSTRHGLIFSEDFDAGISKLIISIDCALDLTLDCPLCPIADSKPAPPRQSSFPSWAAALMVIVSLLALGGAASSWYSSWRTHQPSAAIERMIKGKHVEILSPKDGARVPFRMGGLQGGSVTLSGRISGISESDTILLTLTAADDGIERPQYGGTAIHPDADGMWTKDVQVGSTEFPPKSGDGFTVRAYIIPKRDFNKLQMDSRAGSLTWPPEDNPGISCIASRSFTLTN